MSMLPRLNLITAVWGGWHTDAFLHACLPSLFADGNLPALTARLDCRYRLVTDAASAATIRASQSFSRLAKQVETDLIILGPEAFSGSTLEAAVTNQARLWRQQIDRSRAEGAKILFIWPDVVTADGSLRSIGEGFLSGHSVIHIKPVRVVDETFRHAIDAQRDSQGVLTIAPRTMVRLIIDHMHPLVGHHYGGSQHYAFHTENLLQPVGRDGFLLRVLQSDGVAFDPSAAVVDAYLGSSTTEKPPLVLSDSDQFTQASLSPLCKDVDWYMLPNRYSPAGVAAFLVAHESPVTDQLAGIDFAFHCGSTADERWAAAARNLKEVVDDALARREIFRVARALDGCDDVMKARAVMAATVYGPAGRLGFGCRGPVSVFLPDDDAMQVLPQPFLHGLMSGDAPEIWSTFVSEHVVPGILDVAGAIGGSVMGRTPSGRTFELRDIGGDVAVNGRKLKRKIITANGGHQIFCLDPAHLAAGGYDGDNPHQRQR